MSDIVKNYVAAIVAANAKEVAATLGTAIKVMPPGANQPAEGVQKSAMMLSTAGAVVDGFIAVRTYEAGDNWYTILFEGSVDDTAVQFIDQVHVAEDGLIDHVDIFLRPASMAQPLLAKIQQHM